jgi:hypothetical protein
MFLLKLVILPWCESNFLLVINPGLFSRLKHVSLITKTYTRSIFWSLLTNWRFSSLIFLRFFFMDSPLWYGLIGCGFVAKSKWSIPLDKRFFLKVISTIRFSSLSFSVEILSSSPIITHIISHTILLFLDTWLREVMRKVGCWKGKGVMSPLVNGREDIWDCGLLLSSWLEIALTGWWNC